MKGVSRLTVVEDPFYFIAAILWAQKGDERLRGPGRHTEQTEWSTNGTTGIARRERNVEPCIRKSRSNCVVQAPAVEHASAQDQFVLFADSN